MDICAGVAKLGQRREIKPDTTLRRNDPAGKPHPVGVRGFKSHPPHQISSISQMEEREKEFMLFTC